MTLKKTMTLMLTHSVMLALGFALGIYMLPIITAPQAPTDANIAELSADALFQGEFSKAREDSDFLHWGEGVVSLGKSHITLLGRLAPGPDYQVYLSPEFVETEAQFQQLKEDMLHVGQVNTFNNFAVNVPQSVDYQKYNSVIVWCESFEQFITSAQYRGLGEH